MKQKNIVKNISYALKNIWKWDKAFYPLFFACYPTERFFTPPQCLYSQTTD